MKKRGIVFILFITMLLNIFNNRVLAKKQRSKIAYVDLATVIIFHPLMRNYAFGLNRFVNYIPKNISEDKKIEYIQKRELKRRIEIKKVNAKIDAISAQMQFLIQERDTNLLKKLNEDIAILKKIYNKKILINNKKKKDYMKELNAKIEELNINMHRKADELNKRYEKLSKEYNNLLRKKEILKYGTLSETQEIIKKIKKDIFTSIRKIKVKYGYEIILNNWNIKYSEDEDEEFQKAIDNLRYDENGKVKVKALYYSKFFKENSGKTKFDEAEARIQEYSFLRSWYDNKTKITKMFQAGYLNKFVIFGGDDITYHVVNDILKKYNVNKEKRATVLKFIKEIKDEIEFDK